MPQAETFAISPLVGQDVLTTAATPLMGYLNVYNAAAGPLAPVLRQAATGKLGTTCLIGKDENDLSGNAITITCYGAETFFDGVRTTRTLTRPGSYVVLQLMATSAGVARWLEVASSDPSIGSSGSWATTVTSGTAVVMTVNSAHTQEFTGTTAQTVKLPSAGVVAGMEWKLVNVSTQTITVQSASGGSINTLGPGRAGAYIANTNAPPASGWDYTAASTLPVGSIVGTTDTQTLTNKTLTSPTINGGTGTLEGVTIGGTTPSPSITTSGLIAPSVNNAVDLGTSSNRFRSLYTGSVQMPQSVVLSGSQQPWINLHASLSGTAAGFNCANYLLVNDAVVQTDSNYFAHTYIVDHVVSPSVGVRLGTRSQVWVDSVNTAASTQQTAQYIGSHLIANNTGSSVGGTAPSWAAGIGSYWGSVSQSILDSGAINQLQLFGSEISVAARTGSSTASKIGINLTTEIGDAVHGTVEDIAFAVTKLGISGSAAWDNGIIFGRLVNEYSWPFHGGSTMIGAAPPGVAGNPANMGIDWSTVNFTGPAIKVNGDIVGLRGGVEVVKLNADAQGGIEIGRTDNAASTPHIDFHSGSTTVDYDARLTASGGSGSTGAGTLDIYAGTLNFNGVPIVTTIPATTSTATAAGTTTLSIASTQIQVFTGSTTQTVKLPTTSVVAGMAYTIINQSTGAVTVQSSGANTIATLAGSTVGVFVSRKATPTAATDWVASGDLTNATNLPLTGLASAAYNTTPTASTLAEWDANSNLSANAFLRGTTSTATAAGTTTLTIASTQVQVFTGTSTQTVKLPTTSVPAGHQYIIANQSTGALTIQSSGANNVATLAAGAVGTFITQKATPTAAADWAVTGVTSTVVEYTSTTTGIAVPAGITGVWIERLIAPGGGGASGRRGAAGTVRCGGGGGAGGAMIVNHFVMASQLSSTVDITLPAGGVGGAAVTTDNTNGAPGGIPAAASFASGSFLVECYPVTASVGGTNALGTGGTPGFGMFSGGSGAGASATGGVGGQGSSATSGAAAGGGAGGGITSGDVANNGGNGGFQTMNYHLTIAAGGVVGGASPGTGSTTLAGVSGTGAGGGAASITGAAQAGATATGYGAGGGAGGASANGFNSGAGGNGGGGYARLRWEYA